MNKTPSEIKDYIDNISDRINELEKLKSKAEKIELKRSKECCPDVCEIIDKSISNLNIELEKAEKEKNKILKIIETASKVFQTEESEQKSLEKKALRKAKRFEVLIKEQITSLQSLKKTLSSENVCDCD